MCRRRRRSADGLHRTDSRLADSCEVRVSALAGTAVRRGGRNRQGRKNGIFGCREGGSARVGNHSGRRDGPRRGLQGNLWSGRAGGGAAHSSGATSVARGAGLRARRQSMKVGGRGESGKAVSQSAASVDDDGAAGLPEPWRGTKPMEGEGAQSRATGSARNGPDSGARPRSRGSSQSDSTSVRSDGGGVTAGRQRPW